MNACTSCRKLKAELSCELCSENVCKSCVENSEPGDFSFLALPGKPLPAELSHRRYCPRCFGDVVEPAAQDYADTLGRAKEVFVLTVAQSKRIPVLKKSPRKLEIREFTDRDELILRLAFLAAREGYNALIDASVSSQKVRNAGYQKMSWSGSGFPALVDAEKMERYRQD